MGPVVDYYGLSYYPHIVIVLGYRYRLCTPTIIKVTHRAQEGGLH